MSRMVCVGSVTSTKYSPPAMHRHSLVNPTFCRDERRLNEKKSGSENSGENIEKMKKNMEVIQEEDSHKIFTESRAFTGGSDNRNKLLLSLIHI